MKKTTIAALVATVAIATDGIAANLENPLYLPGAGDAYSKLGAGLMYKVADSTEAMVDKGHAGETEFPIWRGLVDLGYGVTDGVAIRGQFGYTHDGDIDRQGMHVGRLGLIGRVFDGKSTDGIVWDVYADAHLGGISKMTGAYTPEGFNYDNYSNGRYGFYVGTQIGKTWDKFTGMAFAEILQTFGNHNNKINVKPTKAYAISEILQSGNPTAIAALNGNQTALAGLIQACNDYHVEAACDALEGIGIAGMTDDISVNLKSTLEWNLGVKGLYEIDSKWSVGGSFTYKHHADNGIKSVYTKQNALSQVVADGLSEALSNMEDGFDEYIFGVSVANQLTDNVQVALYGEYTYDTAHPQAQNTTDFKSEVGARVNVRF
ncbi:MAG: hypothetical protein LBQ49_02340 [Rickettsiales bacterium]|nr:hypothetical protein [Rickettsiales bacterium]